MKSCWFCGSRNELRSLFCVECGSRLSEAAGSAPSPGGTTSIDVPGAAGSGASRGGLMETPGGMLTPVPVALPPVPTTASLALPTPHSAVPVTTAPRSCAGCGYPLPAGATVRWCPGCGKRIGTPGAVTSSITGVVGEAPPASTMIAPPVSHSSSSESPPPTGWSLVQVRAGEKVGNFALRSAHTVIGRTEGDVRFPDDPLLSARHARIVFRSGGFWVEDLGSLNGVYFRLWAPTELEDGDMINIGDLVFIYHELPAGTPTVAPPPEPGVRNFGSGNERSRGVLVRVLRDGTDGPSYPLTPSKTVLGRRQGHLVFPGDPLLSREHAQFYERDGRMLVEDLGSSNGTLIRIRRIRTMERGTLLRMGDQCFEVAGPPE